MSEEDKNRVAPAEHHHVQHQQFEPQYGTFQGVPTYPPPQPPVIGLPPPVPPPGSVQPSAPPPGPPQYYAHAYQTVPGYAVAEGRLVRERRLPCCGIGCGWFLFIIGFFLAAIPWYVGALVLLCSRFDYRERPGYIACAVAAVLATLAIILGVTKGTHDW
ncbi:hypothetical protein F2P56_019996 [Juglans regia]|uniref:60S ribosomal protein L18a-like protein isoform X1 n=2 Tax=Juglans regia TaxID=51240 RepID=A0A2I4F068_JUGRE|nr:60S ribosomal protein L18a-like protein isoform X1 [Juglans regia]KAF5460102.1 hypothetical protein F2P56_019996 [Juglans regia]